ncbi:MAG: zinc-ribbon domain-containing protein [Lachnospiraceae bacterium]|nr:zinc-ribbon domain-containing protein [Lachnospiraceae bacterium]
MFCPNCGNQMKEGAVFCSNCGYRKEVSASKGINFNINKIPFVPILCVVAIIVLVMIGYNAFNNRTCRYCNNKVFKQGLCRDHYTQEVVKDSVSDFTSGNKSVKDAANDIYNKSFTNDEKKQIQDSIDNIKNSFGDLFK